MCRWAGGDLYGSVCPGADLILQHIAAASPSRALSMRLLIDSDRRRWREKPSITPGGEAGAARFRGDEDRLTPATPNQRDSGDGDGSFTGWILPRRR